MGAWIETSMEHRADIFVMSHPIWVRGLKLCTDTELIRARHVAPYMGAWIETTKLMHEQPSPVVAPYMGAWIETRQAIWASNGKLGRTLYGCVD